jgi:hypothetical protein
MEAPLPTISIVANFSSPSPRKQVRLRLRYNGQYSNWIPTPIANCTKEAWEGMYKKRNKPRESEQLEMAIAKEKQRALAILESPTYVAYDYEKFRKTYLSGGGAVQKERDKTNIKQFFVERLNDTKNLKPKTRKEAWNAWLNLNSFAVHQKVENDKLKLENITVQFLKDWEVWNRNERGNKNNTISKYARDLRTVFNTAIIRKVVNPVLYPFARTKRDVDKYKIPASEPAKKYLSEINLARLLAYKEQLPILAKKEKTQAKQKHLMALERTLDYFMFCLLCNGANPKDCAHLTWGNVYETPEGKRMLKFKRAKTGVEVLVPLRRFYPTSPSTATKMVICWGCLLMI